jgi:hypothetical protein
MKNVILAVSFILISFLLTAQTDFFLNTWGSKHYSEGGVGVVQIPGNGPVFYCGFESQADNDAKIAVYKFSPSGVMLDQWLFGPSGNHVPYDMKLVDGHLVIAGETTNSNGDINGLWLRIDTLGNQLNWSTFGLQTRNEVFKGFDVDENGDFVAVGFVSAAQGGGNNALIAKFNQNFQPLYITIDNYSGNDLFQDVGIINGTEYVAVGDRQVDGGPYNLFLMRFNTNCEMVWEFFDFNGFNGGSTELVVSSSDEIVVVGESAGPGWVAFEPTFARFSSEGEPLVQTYLESSVFSDAAFTVCEASPGNYLMAGYGKNPETSTVDVMVIHVNDMGEEQERRYYQGSIQNDIAYSIIPSGEHSFYIAGRSGEFTSGHLLIGDHFDSLVSVGNLFKPNRISAFPNPVGAGQTFRFEGDWFQARVWSASGIEIAVVTKNRELIISNPGLYLVQLYDRDQNIIGHSKVVVR